MADKSKRTGVHGKDYSGGHFDGGAPYRAAMGKQASKDSFTKHASKTHALNMPTRIPMRGGIRL